jgi:hypothetical protein
MVTLKEKEKTCIFEPCFNPEITSPFLMPIPHATPKYNWIISFALTTFLTLTKKYLFENFIF